MGNRVSLLGKVSGGGSCTDRRRVSPGPACRKCQLDYGGNQAGGDELEYRNDICRLDTGLTGTVEV